MKNTLENWYSQNKLTPKQYYQLVDLVNPNTEYTLDELLLLVQLPTTENLPNPNQTNELTRFQTQRNLWDYEDNLNYWLDNEPQASLLIIPHWLRNTIIIALLLLIIYLFFL